MSGIGVRLRMEIWRCSTKVGACVLCVVIVIGDSAVGKTSYISRYVDIVNGSRLTKNIMPRENVTTIGVGYHTKLIDVDKSNGTVQVKAQIWDTCKPPP